MRFKLLQKQYPEKPTDKTTILFNKPLKTSNLSSFIVSPNNVQPRYLSSNNNPIKLHIANKTTKILSPEEIETTPSMTPEKATASTNIIQSYRSLKNMIHNSKIVNNRKISDLISSHFRSNSSGNNNTNKNNKSISDLMRDKTLNSLLSNQLNQSRGSNSQKSFYSVDNSLNRSKNSFYQNSMDNSVNKTNLSISVNKNSEYIFPLNFNELLLLEDKLKTILLKLSRTQPPSVECLDYWAYYYDSSLMNNYLNLFRDSNNAKELDKIAHIDALCLILALDSSTSSDKFIKVSVILKSIFSLVHFNFVLLLKFILAKHYNGEPSCEKLRTIINTEISKNLSDKDLNEYYLLELLKHNVKTICTFVQSILDNFYSNTNLNNSSILNNISSDDEGYNTSYSFTSKQNILSSFFIEAFKQNNRYTYNDYDKFIHSYIDQTTSRTNNDIKRNNNLNSKSLVSINEKNNYVMLYSSTPMYYLPPIDKQYEYSLVLDLDETLIHVVVNRKNSERAKLIFRPFLFEFLRKMKRIFEIILFTVSVPEYANKMISHIERNEKFFVYKLYRQHASKIKGEYVKDLTKLGRDLKKVIIVDNLPQNFSLQKENGICVRPFYGDTVDDHNTLCELGHILERIRFDSCDDVRQSLVKYRERINIKVSNEL